MTTKGIRIHDDVDRVVSVELTDILVEVQDGSSYHWAILYLEATGHLGEGKSMPIFEKQINSSKDGLKISWEELNALAKSLTK
jgi:hypothetical protein